MNFVNNDINKVKKKKKKKKICNLNYFHKTIKELK